MDVSVVLVFIIISAIVAMAAILFFRKKPAPSSDEAASDYAEGLNLLLAGQRERALRKLREAVTKDSQNVDAYLRIGDILRDVGQVDRAINVHKYLTVRPSLTPKQRVEILRSLALDYEKAEEFDKALSVLEKLLEQDRSNSWAYEMRFRLYEKKGEWNRAFTAYKELKRMNGEFKPSRLALYKVQEGLQFSEKGAEKEAQQCFREALKIAPESPPAYIHLADSYKREGRKDEALKVLKQFVEKVPSQSFLAFQRIKDLLYEGGVYGEIENLYLDIIESQPDNLAARLALAENYEKKGDLQKAIRVCKDVLERDPGNKAAKKYLVRLYHVGGQDAEAL
ncbi:MAG: tetratricopeptide repeat protein, partial [Calditrichaeota bacterium]